MTASPAPSVTPRLSSGLLRQLPTRFFGGLPATIQELLQNALRAGAITVDFTLDGLVLRVRDNGQGLHDPQLLMTAGESGWGAEVINPAGLGVAVAGVGREAEQALKGETLECGALFGCPGLFACHRPEAEAAQAYDGEAGGDVAGERRDLHGRASAEQQVEPGGIHPVLDGHLGCGKLSTSKKQRGPEHAGGLTFKPPVARPAATS
ncbi:hypothetical protein LAJ19_16655 (plasmid) [Deinococcus taeanensis]|uniref:ATP-binding protein n=1 Tax=Deinococcus taeanensis TaxID=2737050 RepID=UPI001CDB9FCA|nr:hypothetical protein [Deinococcus taeanensis]UBV44776.1 hypothetical protein LAJ19_16655 [Deinococcus taeanensis]